MKCVSLFGKSILIVISLTILIAVKGIAQQTVGSTQAKAMDMNSFPLGTISQVNFSPQITTGSVYLSDDWLLATIMLSSKTVIKRYPVRMDLLNQLIEINTDQGVRSVRASEVDSLVLLTNQSVTRVFVNGNQVNGKSQGMVSLFEVLKKGKLSLLKYNYVERKEGQYNAVLDMGDNEAKFIKKENFFFYDETNSSLKEIPNSRKKFIDTFEGSAKQDVEDILNAHKFKLKSQDDLISLCELLNKESISLP